MHATARRPAMTARRPVWPLVRRALVLAFFAGIVVLLVRYARTLDWDAVGQAVLALPVPALLLALALAAASHTLYSTFDLFGRHLTGHSLGTGRVMGITFISYAFNLNFGALVGGFAFRFRLYARQGIRHATTAQVLTVSMLTNWLGYLLLGGLVLLTAPPALPDGWELGTVGLRGLGGALLVGAAAWLLACTFARRRRWTVRGHPVVLPSGRLALLQMAVSSLNWALIAGIVYTLLQGQVDYPSVLAALLVAAVAGVLTHVPAGLGVLEAVFVALLSERVGDGPLLAALLAYRAVYYLLPLAVASLAYLLVETRSRRPGARPGDAPPAPAPAPPVRA